MFFFVLTSRSPDAMLFKEFFDTPTSMGQQDLDGGGVPSASGFMVKVVVLQFKDFSSPAAFSDVL